MSTKLGKIIADFQTQLAAPIIIGDTTATLQSATDDDGVALPAGRYFFTVDKDNAQKEHFSCTLSGINLTALKSVSRQGVETSGAVRGHRTGSNVIISDFAHIRFLNDLLDGTTPLDGSTPLIYDANPTLTDSKHLVTKKYIDDLAIAGAPKASTSVLGIAKMSTAPVDANSPIAVGDNDGRIPTQGENDALVGTTGTPSSSNKFVTATDPNFTDTVKLTGDQTVAGVKTLTSIPVLPASDPTTDNQAARKAYVDGLAGTSSLSFSDTGGTIYYRKTGKCYHSFYGNTGNNQMLWGEDSAAADRIATQLGITISSYLVSPDITIGIGSNGSTIKWNGSTWTPATTDTTPKLLLHIIST